MCFARVISTGYNPLASHQTEIGSMPESQYWHEVLVSLRRIIRATDLQSKRMMKLSGLTIPQIVVMRAIESLGNVTVRKISDHVSLSQATVTSILNRLEAKQLVERIRSKTDKRAVNARLTRHGSDILVKAPPLLHEKFIERFESLEPGRRHRYSLHCSVLRP